MGSAIVHWGGKGSTPWWPACKRSLPGNHCHTTQNADEVTCARCCALLGKAAPAREESRNVKGTCACCFSEQRTRTDGASATGRMFHHGYQRPGVGYIVGPCPGHRFLPYERSCDGTRYVLGLAQEAREGLLKQIAKVTAADKLTVRVEIGTERQIFNGRRGERLPVVVEVEVVRGGPEVAVERTQAYRYLGPICLTFDTVQAERLGELRGNLGRVEYDIQYFEKKVADWR